MSTSKKTKPNKAPKWKRVRAWNVAIGDQLSFFDLKKGKEQHMLVVGFDRSFPGVQQLLLRFSKRARTTYHWNMKSTSLLRVLRGCL